MPEAITEKAVCEKCGADVRDGTTFCYNCGTSLEKKSVIDDGMAAIWNRDGLGAKPENEELAAVTKIDDASADDKLSRAAEQRRKARVSQRKTNEYIWEPADDSRFVMLIALLIAAIALGVVFLTVFWK